MKILGIGIDLVKNSKIQNAVNKNYAERFIKKFLHPKELEKYFSIQKDEQKVTYLASRWAIKEALNKAIGRKQLVFNQIYVDDKCKGKYTVYLEGDQNERLQLELQISRCHVYFSYQEDYTIATAVVEQNIS